ncbi:S46 family peptidase [Alistipes ihumii]|uniref:S46 family peptidase n=1 Tax=Alistipes ihumii TaxID=1470347 RepID=UPI003995EA0D
MKKLLIACLLLALGAPSLKADEGMWLLPYLEKLNIRDMKAKGFKLSAKDIYNLNGDAIKDAIVIFGNGCTGEIVSDRGLLLTNHHCGFDAIQSHSSVEHDYLKNGFWAMSDQEEIPTPGLTVTFIRRISDVSDRILPQLSDTLSEKDREAKVAEIVERIKKETELDNEHQEVEIQDFFGGNQYLMFVKEIFKDVRLVGAPPSSIGKFGGDTDNWMWPRHTGDFSLFRIYAGPDNAPADYSKDNVPFRPRRSLAISTRGLREGDFTFIYGFPGQTQQYVLSDAVDYLLNRGNPHKIALRTMRLDIMSEEQAKDADTRIRYASKHASVANAWKKWQGESRGLERLGTLGKKREQESRFDRWAASHPQYTGLLGWMKALYAELEPYAFARDYYNEAYRAVELSRFASAVRRMPVSKRAAAARAFYKDYSPSIDRRIAERMLGQYLENVPQEFRPEAFVRTVDSLGGVREFVDDLFGNSLFTAPERFERMTAGDSATAQAAIEADPAVRLADAFDAVYRDRIFGRYRDLSASIASLYRTYMRGLMEMEPDAVFYPDANLTLRVSYGRMEGYKPLDGVYYTPQTTLEGIMEKDDPTVYDYNIPQRLRDLYASKDYGRWAVDGTVPVAFLATNHTTGGNSGSPVLNGRGELVGLNFDRTWESTMSDIEFDPSKCRNIAVDIRYVLFLIDKVGGAGYLLDEMDIR